MIVVNQDKLIIIKLRQQIYTNLLVSFTTEYHKDLNVLALIISAVAGDKH